MGFNQQSSREIFRGKQQYLLSPPYGMSHGLTGLEALAAGSALLTTDRGGIPEYASGRAVMIKLSGTERVNRDEAEFQDAMVQELNQHLR